MLYNGALYWLERDKCLRRIRHVKEDNPLASCGDQEVGCRGSGPPRKKITKQRVSQLSS